MKKPNLQHLIAESHRRQLAGEDYQAVAIDLADEAGYEYESSEFGQLQSMPAESCGCATCRVAEWYDE